MKRQEVIQFFCELQAWVRNSLGDYSTPQNGFCDQCAAVTPQFQNPGKFLHYILLAVSEKLQRDGKYTIPTYTYLTQVLAQKEKHSVVEYSFEGGEINIARKDSPIFFVVHNELGNSINSCYLSELSPYLLRDFLTEYFK